MVAHALDTGGTRWILRLPRRADVLPRAAAERAALALVSARLPVAVPNWRVHNAELIAYPRLDGEPAAVIDLSAGGYRWRFDPSAPPTPFVESFGATLAALHAIPVDAAAAAGLRVRSPDRIRQELREGALAARELLRIPPSVTARWERWIDDDGYWPTRSRPVHGDLHPAHILVNPDGRVIGLLDWTEAHVADAGMDFTLQYAAMGGEALDALLAAYGSAGGEVYDRMRAHVVESWAGYPITVASFARVTGEEVHRLFAQQLVDGLAGSEVR